MSTGHNISKQEKIAIMYLLNAICRADEKVEQDELDYLQFFTQQHHLVLDQDEFKQQKLDQLCANIHSPQAKRLTIEEVIKLALCDGNYHQSERSAAMLLANMLELNQEDFLCIEQAIIEGECK